MLKHFKQLPSRLHGLDATNPSVQIFHFKKWAKWAFPQRGDGKLELQAGFARIAFVVQNQTVILELRLIMGSTPLIFWRAT
jgi:hypothetical protein